MWKRADRAFTTMSSWISDATGQPLAFVLALGTVVVWAVTGPVFHYSETWQLVINTGTTIVTFLMVFLIQNSQNRDMAAIQSKLDELIYAMDGAREQFIGIERLSTCEVEGIRRKLEHEVRDNKDVRMDHSVAHMIKRL